MGLIYLAAYKARGGSFNALIRWWTGSIYSHVELVMPDGRWLSASASDGGVRAKRIEQNPEHWDLIPLPWADEAWIDIIFNANQGKGYDWLGLFFSQFLARGWHSQTRMFCSEFCAKALGLNQRAQHFSPVLLIDVALLINRQRFVQLAHSLKGAGNENDAR